MQNEKLMRLLGIRESDTQPQDRVGDLESAIVEVADLSAENEVSIEDLTQAVLELAEMIGG